MRLKFNLIIAMCFLVEAYSAQNRAGFHHVIKRKWTVETKSITPTGGLTSSTNTSHKVKLVRNGAPIYLCSKKLKGVIILDKGVPVFDVWQIKSEPAVITADPQCINNTVNPNPVTGATNRIEIDLSRPTIGDPTKVIHIPFNGMNYGVISVPLRCRQSVDTLPLVTTTGVNLAGYFGYMWGWSSISQRAITHYSGTISLFTGFVPVDLKKSQYTDQSKYKYDQTNLGICYGLSLVLARNNLGITISGGFDSAMGRNANYWIYHEKFWFGLGLNTSLGFF